METAFFLKKNKSELKENQNMTHETNFVQLTIPKFDSSHYDYWSMLMENFPTKGFFFNERRS